ncbi:MAG: hypothetical protein OSB31_07080 [Paracoccaceae bacterium]|nr:hypothetical protein [Paracoccaceae bacterium]
MIREMAPSPVWGSTVAVRRNIRLELVSLVDWLTFVIFFHRHNVVASTLEELIGSHSTSR